MEKHPHEEHDRGLFEDDDLDAAIANVDDTGMVKQQQVLAEEEQVEALGHNPEPEDNPS